MSNLLPYSTVERQYDSYSSYPEQQQSPQEYEYDFAEQPRRQSGVFHTLPFLLMPLASTHIYHVEHAVQGWPSESQAPHFNVHDRGHGEYPALSGLSREHALIRYVPVQVSVWTPCPSMLLHSLHRTLIVSNILHCLGSSSQANTSC